MKTKLECPHCRYMNERYPEDLNWEEDSETEITCGDCEKVFIARPNIRITFVCEKQEKS